ncbi:putative amidophosphoribosyltransferase [Streptomyces pseudovenezuelae]|uniref:Amidophosphoribosyltransferase n=1 Tax=Streptomyces pseudovenezuelae TaxID=67350 RepID=A0ABT6LZQ9_9ACTN|nr:putative amidophosphoribosyltransferase [Streptomyces pseudovenezuelae]
MLCPECRAVLSGAAPCRVRPVPEPPGLPVVHAAARYSDEVRAMLLAHKERGALALTAPLGAALAGAVRAGLGEAETSGAEMSRGGARFGGAVPERRAGAGVQAQGDLSGGAPVLLVPVPSAGGAVRARGHDPARRIALAAAGELRRTGTRARVLAVLRQKRAVADQSGLNSRQRLDNLAGALAVASGGAGLLRGGRVVLVDDLMTTGASLTEAARAVWAARAAGAATGVRAEAEGLVSQGRVPGRGTEPGTDRRGEPYGRSHDSHGRCSYDSHGHAHDDPRTPVYAALSREDGGERTTGSSDAVDVICAAVVAASPDSFEINRN